MYSPMIKRLNAMYIKRNGIRLVLAVVFIVVCVVVEYSIM